MKTDLSTKERASLLRACAGLVGARQRAGERPRHRGLVIYASDTQGEAAIEVFAAVEVVSDSKLERITSDRLVVTHARTGETLARSEHKRYDVVDTTQEAKP
jgi:hypothetical protein